METVTEILNLFAPIIFGLGLVFAVVVIGTVFLDHFIYYIYDTLDPDKDDFNGMFGGE